MASRQSTVFKNTVEGQKLVTASSKFALNLYKQAAANAGNIFVSPMSISIAMAMTYLGTRGKTMSQIRAVMFFGDVKEAADLHEAFSDVRTALNSPNDGAYELLIANKLFGSIYSVESGYRESCERYYGTALEHVNFSDRPSAVKIINNWVAENTNQKIKDLLAENNVDSLTRLIIVNAIYFKGDWAHKFDAIKTRNEDFHLSATETVKVPLMSMTEAKVSYGVHPKLNCQAIELPYVKNALSMFVILPDRKVTDIRKVEQNLTVEDLINIYDSFRMHKCEVYVRLPRFKIDEKLKLNEILKKIGIVDLFRAGKADLTGIINDSNHYVSEVLHQACVEVNEEGSEAAAATAVIIKTRCARIPQFTFIADHPFLFLIRENSTNSILFFGRLSKP